MLIQPARRDYRTWVFDSRRWQHYRPRPDDIIIATYPKCGTTWMQRIVSLLVFQTTEPTPVMQLSAWIDRRFPQPIETVIAQLEAQEHRRFLKSHLPLDGLPFHDDVRYIHVARDGRDACISFHNHARSFNEQMMRNLDKSGNDDETIGRPYPPVDADPARFFHQWITQGEVPGQTTAHRACPSSTSRRAGGRSATVRTSSSSTTTTSRPTFAERWSASPNSSIFRSPSTGWPSFVEDASFEAMRREVGNADFGDRPDFHGRQPVLLQGDQ